nr:ornithine cyclodeaminase [uncultured Blautia sp.]
MKIIAHRDIMEMQISPSQCFDWVDYILRNKHSMKLPPKISMKMEGEIFYNTMPSILPKESIAGVKVVSRYPSRMPALDSQILLYNLDTGEQKAVLDGNFITTMRTGAVAVHAIQLLAVKSFQEIGVIGVGNTMRAAMKVLLTRYPDKKMRIKIKKYKKQHLDFIEAFSGYPNVEFVVCEDYKEVIDGSDVILSAVTYAEEDFCEDKYFKEGCLVVPIHTRGFTNCDLFFDKVFADDRGHVQNFKYFNKFKSFAEISDVLEGTAKGRENDEERILAYNIGISLHDIYFAEQIYQLAKIQGKGTECSLEAPKDKFWI